MDNAKKMMANSKQKKVFILALCGKGGVGKTSISATIVKILSSNPDNKVRLVADQLDRSEEHTSELQSH